VDEVAPRPLPHALTPAQPLNSELMEECARLDELVDSAVERVEQLRKRGLGALLEAALGAEAVAGHVRTSIPPLSALQPVSQTELQQAGLLIKSCNEKVNALSAQLPSSLDRAELTIAAVRESKRMPETDIDKAVKSTATNTATTTTTTRQRRAAPAGTEFPALESSRQIAEGLEAAQHKRQRQPLPSSSDPS
jgi:hypothetical protein